MTWLWPSLLGLSRVVRPDTILRWHRAGFRAYWRWKSCGRPGRPRVSRELRELIQRMGKENPLWGAPRIHGELLKLGFEIAESTVSKYIRRRGPPSQTWRTFLRNHADAICIVRLPLFLSLYEIEPDRLRCQGWKRSLLRHSPSLPGERPRRNIPGTDLRNTCPKLVCTTIRCSLSGGQMIPLRFRPAARLSPLVPWRRRLQRSGRRHGLGEHSFG
jgi:hypothetical protein